MRDNSGPRGGEKPGIAHIKEHLPDVGETKEMGSEHASTATMLKKRLKG